MLTREAEQRQAIEIHDFAVDVIGILRGYVSRKILQIFLVIPYRLGRKIPQPTTTYNNFLQHQSNL